MRLTVEATTVKGMVMYAYGVRNFQVVTGSSYTAVGDTPYDIVARAEGEAPPSKAQFREMLRTLLADRFQLRIHRETRETPVFAVVIAKNGPKLKEPDPKGGPVHMSVEGPNNVLTMPNATMRELAGALDDAFLGRPVVDRTGLTGTYKIELTYTPEYKFGRGEPDPREINLATALPRQLGLRLEPQTAPFEYLVVDHVAKPTQN